MGQQSGSPCQMPPEAIVLFPPLRAAVDVAETPVGGTRLSIARIADLANGFANSKFGQLRTLPDYAAVRDPRAGSTDSHGPIWTLGILLRICEKGSRP